MPGGTCYVGGEKKVYSVCIRIEKPYWMRVKDVENKIHDILDAVRSKDETYYFNDDDSLKDVLDWIEEADKYVYYSFVCDRNTYKKLHKSRKYYGFQINKTGGQWI